MANANVDPSHVKFGKNIYINVNMRLPQFDNGNSLAYRAYNSLNKESRFIAIVSGVENIPRWSSVANYSNLADTSFLHLVGSGIVNWPLENRQKYVFMYSNDLGECLVPEGGFSDHHWRHPDIVDYFIHPMIRMFKEMSDKNFAHGSIRPSNIYYSSADKIGPVILGDGLSVQAGSTQDPVFLPPSIAMAEPMGRGNASIKSDIYAFGVSLVFFLRKSNAIEGLKDDELVRKKLEVGSYNALIGNERFQASFLELLRGVLHDDVTQRWGLEEMFAWLDGSRLTPAALSKKKKANRPLTFNGDKHLYAEFLALDIHKNPRELAAIVEDGSLGRWIEKSIDDSSMSERYRKALERAAGFSGNGNDEYLATQVALALNSSLPIRYKGRCFTYDGIGAMMVKSVCDGENLDYYKEVINLNLPDQALMGAGLNQSEIIATLKLYDNCRAAISRAKIGYGIEKCIYMLCKDAPCLSPSLKQYFINGNKSVLMAFEALCKKGGQISLMLDRHLAAFFAVNEAGIMDSILYDLSSPDKNNQVAGNLRFMAAMQKKARVESVNAIANVFLESLSGVYTIFKNRKMREIIKEGITKAAKEGDLIGMVALLNDTRSLARDKKAFQIAMTEYKMLQDEYDEYNRKLANKKTYGVVNGRDMAAVISWMISTAISVIVILAFLSGNRIF